MPVINLEYWVIQLKDLLNIAIGIVRVSFFTFQEFRMVFQGSEPVEKKMMSVTNYPPVITMMLHLPHNQSSKIAIHSKVWKCDEATCP